MSAPEPARGPRSTFVSVVAWMGIVSGAVGALVFCLVVIFAPSFQNILGLLSSTAMLVASVGLWRRRDRARQAFMALLGYSAVMGIVGALRMRVPTVSDITATAGALPPGVSPGDIADLGSMVRTAALAITLVIAAVNVLVILKLRSPRVRAEFAPAEAGPREGAQP